MSVAKGTQTCGVPDDLRTGDGVDVETAIVLGFGNDGRRWIHSDRLNELEAADGSLVKLSSSEYSSSLSERLTHVVTFVQCDAAGVVQGDVQFLQHVDTQNMVTNNEVTHVKDAVLHEKSGPFGEQRGQLEYEAGVRQRSEVVSALKLCMYAKLDRMFQQAEALLERRGHFVGQKLYIETAQGVADVTGKIASTGTLDGQKMLLHFSEMPVGSVPTHTLCMSTTYRPLPAYVVGVVREELHVHRQESAHRGRRMHYG